MEHSLTEQSIKDIQIVLSWLKNGSDATPYNSIQRIIEQNALLRGLIDEKNKIIDDARAQKPTAWRPKFDIEGDWSLGEPSIESIEYWHEQGLEIEYAYLRAAPVPAQPSHFRARLIELCQPWTPANLDRIESCEEIVRAVAEGPHSQPAAAKGSTHCDDCGCDWLDNGLNPIGCPYCKRNNDKFNQCLNSLVRQCALMMDDCEEHADGTITIDYGISQGFLRRIYDLLSALEACGYDAIEPQPAAVPEAVAKDAALRETLAEIAHSQWSGWMEYLFSKGNYTSHGTWVMPAWAVERWSRQMKTAYADLSHDEKESDRKEADKFILALLSAADDEVKNGIR